MVGRKRLPFIFVLLSILLAITGIHPIAAWVQTTPDFADEAFKKVWTRTDSLVANGNVKRSWYWGPQPNSGPIMEDHAEGVGGKRLVQYFDKSRMEINNPNGNKNDPFYVTNGLLAKEMIEGHIQVGNNRFVDHYPAEIPLASDSDDRNAPTYQTFGGLINYLYPDKRGQTVIDTISRDRREGRDNRYARYNVKYAHYEEANGRNSRSNIPDVFWSFLNSTGPVIVNGKQVTARLNDPYFYATGYAMSEAYWSSVKIGGKPNTDVLIQVYERRVLTYVPSAPEGFKVQMGNIGQHYYAWRYQRAGRSIPANICKDMPPRGFGKLWLENESVQFPLLCPENYETNVAIQHFERGHMIYRGPLPLDRAYNTGSVYALFEDGTAQAFCDCITQQTPEPAPTPPPGLYAPQMGFGKIWSMNSAVRERLGWATAPEKAIQRTDYQFFFRGLMVKEGPQIYVLYLDLSFVTNNPTHWEVYEDTYKP